MELTPTAFRILAAFAFVLGAAIGSFLNVCIYRLPRDLSVNEPRRSYCPACRHPIPWSQNIPLLSWLWLRGKCAHCGSAIAFRYFAVELLTALLFLAVWVTFPTTVALAYLLFVSLLIVATFIDFEHFIIPDQISLGGAAAGVIACLIWPELMQQSSRLLAVLYSLGAAIFGYGLLWLVMEGGKKLFGKVRLRFTEPAAFHWQREGEDAELLVGEERSLWSEHFARKSDLLRMSCTTAQVEEKTYANPILLFRFDQLTIAHESFQLDELNTITGFVRELHLPREAMGQGDLKFIAAIGAFLGWQGILCSIFAGSLLGSVVGLSGWLLGRRAWSARIPFGPYLALGALLWMFAGPGLVAWYLGLLSP